MGPRRRRRLAQSAEPGLLPGASQDGGTAAEGRGGGSVTAPTSAARRHRVRAAVAAVAAVALAAGGWALVAGSSNGAGPGGRAPDFKLARVDDPAATVSLKDFAGRPLVINFWASWCVPCRKEMPAFQAASERLAGRVAFVGVNHQDSRAGAQELLGQTGVRYPTGYDPDGDVAAAYGLFGMPTTVFVSPSGKVLEQRVGELSADELDRALARHFAV